tara:strand:+ start:1288 stop:1725 length:438 start_codon:yes stop_codon:yes gene_type:complete
VIDSKPSLNPIQETINHTVKRGKLEILTGLMGLNNLQHASIQSQKNQEAENAHVRKEAWGFNESAESSDEMQQTVLGDLQTTTNITNQPSQIGKFILGAGLLATGVGGPVGAYFIADAIKNKEPDTIIETTPVTDTDSIMNWSLE